MNEDHKPYVIAIVLVVVLIGLALWASVFWRGADNSAAAIQAAEKLRKDIPVEAVYPDRIVYTSDMNHDVGALKSDCELRQGEFNDCGRACDGESCALVCAYTCEF